MEVVHFKFIHQQVPRNVGQTLLLGNQALSLFDPFPFFFGSTEMQNKDVGLNLVLESQLCPLFSPPHHGASLNRFWRSFFREQEQLLFRPIGTRKGGEEYDSYLLAVLRLTWLRQRRHAARLIGDLLLCDCVHKANVSKISLLKNVFPTNNFASNTYCPYLI